MNNITPQARRRLPAVAGIAGCTLLAASITFGADASAMAAPLSLTATDSATLIAAIAQANANPGHDTITLPAGTITLDADLPKADDAVTIVGAGAAETTIDGAGSFLTLDLVKGGTVSGLTVVGSRSTGVTVGGGESTLRDVGAHKNVAGGISLWLDAGTATLEKLVTNGNLSNGVEVYASETAIVNLDGLTAVGNSYDGLEVNAEEGARVVVSQVTARENGNHGVELSAEEADTHISLQDSSVSQQTVEFEGLSLDADYGARILVSQTTVADNPAGGVDLWVTDGHIEIIDSVIRGNGNGEHEGGLSGTLYASEEGSLTVRGSSITGNHGSNRGIDLVQHGISQVRFVDTTIANNNGTGLHATMDDESELTVAQSTISRNHGSSNGAMKVQGVEGTPKVSILHSTIVENDSYEMGGVTVLDAALVIDHSIVANNDKMADVTHNANKFPTINHSLIREAGPESAVQIVLGTGEGNLTDIDPMLNALGANGGATLTHLPQAGSPVVDAGRADFDGVGLNDQRGKARVAGPLTDLGSVEVQLPDVVIPEETPEDHDNPAAVIAVSAPEGKKILPVTGGSISPIIAAAGVLLLGFGAAATVGARRRAARN